MLLRLNLKKKKKGKEGNYCTSQAPHTATAGKARTESGEHRGWGSSPLLHFYDILVLATL